MQRSHLLRWLGLAIGLLGTQCLDSISDDCTKTLTCEDAEQPVLRENCVWEYPGGRVWAGGPRYDAATRTWRWPDGKPTASQNFQCNIDLVVDAGGDGGPGGPDCRLEPTLCEGQFCDPGTGECVECITDAECAGNMAMGDAGAATVCDLATHRCVECVGNEHCTGDTRVCKVNPSNSRRNACVECINGDTCSEATPICDERTNDCTAACQTSADCGGDKPVCNTERNLCVECLQGNDCSGNPAKPLCDTENNECVECLDDGPCAAANRGVCNLETHSCVQCREDQQCQSDPSLAVCDPESNVCVQCLNDQQCTAGDASRCNASHVCAGCTNSSQCEGNLQCRNGECVECLTDAHCPTGELCETTRGLCVECFDTSQCNSAEQARCETQQNATALYTCVGCTSNEDCTGDGKLLPPLCDTGRGGICSECIVAEGPTGCRERGPALSRCQNGTCSVCSIDADCVLYDNAESNLPACRPNVGCVQCTNATHCQDTPDTPLCKTGDGGTTPANTCVECLSNADCQGNPNASLCSNNQCVPCAADGDCALVDSNGTAPGGIALNVCDAGECVQCSGAKRTACGEFVCDATTKQCAPGRTARSAGLCGPCVSDQECAETARCVQQTFEGQNIGFFCFPTAPGTPPACAGPRIYLNPTNSPTIDRETPTPTVCQPRRTTCVAIADLAQATACDTAADCGAPAIADGICDPGLDLCTVPCTGGADCFGTCDLDLGACEP